MTVGRVSLYSALDYLYCTASGDDLVKDVGRSMLARGRTFDAGVRGDRAPTEAPPDRFDATIGQTLENARDNANPHYGAWGQGERYLRNGPGIGLSSAIIQSFARIADENGFVSLERAEQAFGTRGRSLLEAIAKGIQQPGPRLSANPRGKWSAFTDDATIRKVARSMGDDGLAPKMPALARVVERFGKSQPLQNFDVLAIQHLFPSTGTLFDAMQASGMRSSSILGKAYSSDADTMRRLDSRGYKIVESGSESDAVTIERQISQNQGVREQIPRAEFVRRWLGEALAKLAPGKKLLLLDEGAYMIRALHEHYPDQVSRCVAVEQTERGIQIIQDELGGKLGCPVLNVAQSWAKKKLESPMIGESVVSSMETFLRDAAPDLEIKPKEAVILGFGAVGQATAAALLRRGFKVYAWDPDPEKRKMAAAQGCTAPEDRKAALEHGHMVIGCSGRGSMSLEDLESIPTGAVLANAASGNHELGTNADAFKGSLNRGATYNDMTRWSDFGDKKVKVGESILFDATRSHVVHKTESGKEYLFLCSGYVVNMSHDIPPEYIQLTRSLLLQGCIEATAAKKPGLVSLSEGGQKMIVEDVKKALSKEGKSLEAPDFRTQQPPASVHGPRQYANAYEIPSLLVRSLGGAEGAALLDKPGFGGVETEVWELEQQTRVLEMFDLDYPHPPEVAAKLETFCKTLAKGSPEAAALYAAEPKKDSGDLILLRAKLEATLLEKRAAGRPDLLDRVRVAKRQIVQGLQKRLERRKEASAEVKAPGTPTARTPTPKTSVLGLRAARASTGL